MAMRIDVFVIVHRAENQHPDVASLLLLAVLSIVAVLYRFRTKCKSHCLCAVAICPSPHRCRPSAHRRRPSVHR